MADRARSDWPLVSGAGTADAMTLADTLLAIEDMLRGVASGRPLNRHEASNYTDWRLRLLQSELQPVLPGFLYQCVSLLRFKDFITLYDPEVEHRQRFIGRTLAAARTALGLDDEVAPTIESAAAVSADPREALRSANWMR